VAVLEIKMDSYVGPGSTHDELEAQFEKLEFIRDLKCLTEGTGRYLPFLPYREGIDDAE